MPTGAILVHVLTNEGWILPLRPAVAISCTTDIYALFLFSQPSAPCSRSSPQSSLPPPSAKCARLRDPEPAAPHGRGPRERTCLSFCSSCSTFSRVGASDQPGAVQSACPHLRERPGLARAFRYRDRLCRSGLESLVASGRPCHRLWLKEPPPRQPGYLDGDWIFDPSRPSMRPRILILNDFAPSTNSTRTIRDGVGTIRLLDGPGNRIALS